MTDRENESRVILVVDDERSVRNVARRLLERLGFTVLEADDGAQALYICEAFGAPPDLIISDIRMPEVSGGDLVRELRRLGREPFGLEALAAKVGEVLNE